MASEKLVVDDASVKSGYAFGPARPYLSMDIQRGTAKVSTICQRIGRYVLIDAVGRGAMGIVYRAEDPSIYRTVAVKVLHPNKGMTPQQIHIARERFRREAQTIELPRAKGTAIRIGFKDDRLTVKQTSG